MATRGFTGIKRRERIRKEERERKERKERKNRKRKKDKENEKGSFSIEKDSDKHKLYIISILDPITNVYKIKQKTKILRSNT